MSDRLLIILFLLSLSMILKAPLLKAEEALPVEEIEKPLTEQPQEEDTITEPSDSQAPGDKIPPPAPRLIRLNWNRDDYALRYEVIVEMEEKGLFTDILHSFTDTYSIELSLLPGKYRCQVIPYDFLEKTGDASSWVNFEVRAPARPRIREPIKEKEIIPEPDYSGAPEDIYLDEHTFLFVPPDEKNAFVPYLSMAWMPVFSLYGKTEPFFGKNLSLAGAGLRFGVLYSELDFLKFGPELTGAWYIFKNANSGNEYLFHNALAASLNMVLHFHFLQKMALRLRIGGGILYMVNEAHAFHMDMGASYYWLFGEHLFLETGFESVYLFTQEPSGYMRPWLGLGWQF